MQNIVCKFTVFSIKIALKKTQNQYKTQKTNTQKQIPNFFNTVGDIVKDSSKL